MLRMCTTFPLKAEWSAVNHRVPPTTEAPIIVTIQARQRSHNTNNGFRNLWVLQFNSAQLLWFASYTHMYVCVCGCVCVWAYAYIESNTFAHTYDAKIKNKICSSHKRNILRKHSESAKFGMRQAEPKLCYSKRIYIHTCSYMLPSTKRTSVSTDFLFHFIGFLWQKGWKMSAWAISSAWHIDKASKRAQG